MSALRRRSLLYVGVMLVLASCGDQAVQGPDRDASRCVFTPPSQEMSSIDDLRLEVERQLQATPYSWTTSLEADKLVVELPNDCRLFGDQLVAYARDRVVVTELPGEIRPL